MVDSQSHEPIQGVRVHRVVAGGGQPAAEPTHGGEIMEDAPIVVTTDKDGGFVVDSQRDIALFKRLNWYSVSIVFEHPSYQPLTETYRSSNAVTTASGEPLVKAGDVLLVPVLR